MQTNRSRVLKQLFVTPILSGIVAVPLWVVSALVAPHVSSAFVFYDWWLGLLSIISGIGAIVLTAVAVGGSIDSLNALLKD